MAGNGTMERMSARRRDCGEAAESRPRFSRQAPDVRRQQIVDAAVRCLAKGGVGAFTVSAICAEAGISHGLINHYFASKEDLLVAVYEKVTDGLADFTRAILAGRHEPEDKLRAIVDASFSEEIFHEANLSVWLALWGQVRNNPGLRAAHKELYDGYRIAIGHQVSSVAQKRKLSLDAPRLALSLCALIDGLWLEWCLDPKVFSPAEAKTVCYDLLQARLGAL